jgi:hypothetical protein
MTGGISPKTCWASYKYEIRFWYTVASCWIFFVNNSTVYSLSGSQLSSWSNECKVSSPQRFVGTPCLMTAKTIYKFLFICPSFRIPFLFIKYHYIMANYRWQKVVESQQASSNTHKQTHFSCVTVLVSECCVLYQVSHINMLTDRTASILIQKCFLDTATHF